MIWSIILFKMQDLKIVLESKRSTIYKHYSDKKYADYYTEFSF